MAEILIVEDSPTQSMQLENILTENGHTLRTAPNGKIALAAVRKV